MSLSLLGILILFASFNLKQWDNFKSYSVNPRSSHVRTFWKDNKGEKIKSLSRLKEYMAATGRKLSFAMNCGMFMEDYSPVGLYIEEGKQL